MCNGWGLESACGSQRTTPGWAAAHPEFGKVTQNVTLAGQDRSKGNIPNRNAKEIAGSDGAGAQAEASLSLQPGEAGTGSAQAGKPRSVSFAAIPETDGRSKGREPGSVFGSRALWIFALKEVPQGTTQSQKGILPSGAKEGRASTAGRDTGDTRGKGCSGPLTL